MQISSQQQIQKQKKADLHYKLKMQKKYFQIFQEQTIKKLRQKYFEAYDFLQRKLQLKVFNGFMLDSIKFQQMKRDVTIKYCKKLFRKYFDLLKWCKDVKINTQNKTLISSKGQNKSNQSSSDKKKKQFDQAYDNHRNVDDNRIRQQNQDQYKKIKKQFFEEEDSILNYKKKNTNINKVQNKRQYYQKQNKDSRDINKKLFPPLQAFNLNKNQQLSAKKLQQNQNFNNNNKNSTNVNDQRFNRTASHQYFNNPKDNQGNPLISDNKKQTNQLIYTRQRFYDGKQGSMLSDSRRSYMTVMNPGSYANIPKRKYAPITQIPTIPKIIPQQIYQRSHKQQIENKEDLLIQSGQNIFKQRQKRQNLQEKQKRQQQKLEQQQKKKKRRKQNIIDSVIKLKQYELKVFSQTEFKNDQSVKKYCQQNKKYLDKLMTMTF